MKRHRHLLSGSSILAGLVLATLVTEPGGAADPIRLNPGYVSLVKVDQAVGTIVIGNPDVVDATLQGKNAILLTAKKITGSAATNLIILNSQDSEIFNATIIVGEQGNSKTEVHSKGRAGGLHEYWAYRCMPGCERVEDKLETFQRSPTVVAGSISPTIVVPPGQAGSSGSDGSSGQNVPQY